MTEDAAISGEQRLQNAMEAAVPEIYFNGFVNSLGTGDIVSVLERNGKPVATLNMSYTTAKTLATSLGAVIAKLEEATGREMLTTHDVGRLMASEEEGE